MLDIQEWCGNRVIIYQKNLKHVGYILFDGSQMVLRNLKGQTKKNQKTICIVVNKYGVLTRTCAPKNVLISKGACHPKTLEELIFNCCNRDGNNHYRPKNKDETVAWLKENKMDHRVIIRWCYFLYPVTSRAKYVNWITPSLANCKIDFVLDAFTGKDGLLCFRIAFKKDNLSRRKVLMEMKEMIQTGELSQPLQETAHADNRSCGYSLSITGLSQAYKLGAIPSQEEFLQLSSHLTKSIPGAWFHLDSANNICHAAFCNNISGNIHCFEIKTPKKNKGNDDDNSDNSAHWTSFFDHVMKECETVKVYRKILLQSILDRLNENGDTEATMTTNKESKERKIRSTRYKCFLSLQSYTNKVRVHLYSTDDRVLHALKLPFVHYLCTKSVNSSKTIRLKTTSKRNIISLESQSVSFENICHLLEQAKSDANPFEDEGMSLFRVAHEWRNNLCLPLLISKPVVESGVPIHVTRVYVPGQTMATRSRLGQHLEKRVHQLLPVLNWTYVALSEYLCQTYCLDLATLPFQTLACLSLKCIFLSFYSIGGPMAQSIEKTKVHYARKLRNYARGGFSYSIKDTINYGQSLSSDHEDMDDTEEVSKHIAVGIQEYDVTSCYGFSACNMRAPGGFCVGYTRNEETDKLERTDSLLRVNTFEYRGCMYLINKMIENGHRFISVYSNFSPLGLFYVGKYPIDLVLVEDNPTRDTYLIQYDGQFAHGCHICPSLPRYVNDSPENELIARTRKRNETINEWIHLANSGGDLNSSIQRQRFYYEIITDCHHIDFSPVALSNAFSNIPKLKHLVDPYHSLPRSRNASLKIEHILNAHPDLTYLIAGVGAVPVERRNSAGLRNGKLLIWKRDEEKKWVQDFGWETGDDGAMFTRDTLENAVGNYGFYFERIDFCYFYKRCAILPRIYQRLIDERINYTSLPAKSQFIKSIINYSVGVMGYNPAKQTTYGSAQITNKLPTLRSTIVSNDVSVAGEVDNVMYYLRKSFKPMEKRTDNRIINNALPVFASIVEYGKLRMQQIADFWDAHCIPKSLKICYSNVDNFIVALSAPDPDDLVPADRLTSYLQAKPEYFADKNIILAPGKLKQVWSQNKPGWKFISYSVCNYSAISTNNDQDENCSKQWKMNASSNIVSAFEAYQIQKELLEGRPVTISNTRRVNLLCNTDIKTGQFTLQPKHYL